MLVPDYGSASESEPEQPAREAQSAKQQARVSLAVAPARKRPVIKNRRLPGLQETFAPKPGMDSDEELQDAVVEHVPASVTKRRKKLDFNRPGSGVSSSSLLNMLPPPLDASPRGTKHGGTSIHGATPIARPVEEIDFSTLGDPDAYADAPSLTSTGQGFINFAPSRAGKTSGMIPTPGMHPSDGPVIEPVNEVQDQFGISMAASLPLSAAKSLARPMTSVVSAPDTTDAPRPKPALTDPYPGFYQLPDSSWVQHAMDDILDIWPDFQSTTTTSQSATARDVTTFLPANAQVQDLHEVDRPTAGPARPGHTPQIVATRSESAPMSRGRARGQLSALLKEAEVMRVHYEEKIAEGKANRRAGANKYGF